jgi:hypothetical protein
MLKLLNNGEFSEKTKRILKNKATSCQMCGLSGEFGECAHIVASGQKGPRNKKQLVTEGIISDKYDVSDISNGLYLCVICHTMIDKYPENFPYEYLRKIKNEEPTFKEQDHTRTVHDATPTPTAQDTEPTPTAQDATPTPTAQDAKPTPTVQDAKPTTTSQDTKPTPTVPDTKPTLTVRHTKYKMYQCQLCDKILSSKDKLNYHMNEKVCQKTDKTCQKCGKTLCSKSSYQNHVSKNACGNTQITPSIKKKFEQMTRDELITEVTELKTDVTEWKSKYEALRENPQHITNQNIVPKCIR